MKKPTPKARTEIRRIAVNRGYTLEQIGNFCGGNAQMAQRWLDGAAVVRDDFAAKLAEILGLPRGKLTFLLGEARKQFRKANGFKGGR